MLLDFSAYGRVEIINVKTAEEASSLLSHLTYYRTNNMNGYEVKAGLFTENMDNKHRKVEPPHNNYTYGFEDIDEIMLDTIAKRMNFTAKWIPPTDNQFFGYQVSNGTYIGAIGTNEMIYISLELFAPSILVRPCFSFSFSLLIVTNDNGRLTQGT